MKESITINRPAFDTFDVSTVESTLDKLLAECQATVDSVSKLKTADWASVMAPLDEVHNQLSLFWSPVGRTAVICAMCIKPACLS